MDRRTLLVRSVVCAGALATSSATTFGASPPPKRVNFTTLSAGDIILFAEAVKLMQSRLPSDPSSWDFLAATHQRLPINSRAELDKFVGDGNDWLTDVAKYIDFDKLGVVANATQNQYWNSCIHGGVKNGATYKSGHFLSWHRFFLLNFEAFFMAAVTQIAIAKGLTPGFNALPYWDYFKDPTLPFAFRQRKFADGSENPLYISYRNSGINKLTNPAAISTPSRSAMAMKDLLHDPKTIDARALNGFDAAIEASPHDAVHGAVGGLMGRVPTAAWDPVFWIHHCNIDRMWAAWDKRIGSVATDIDQNWKNQDFVFNGPNGQVLWHAESTLKQQAYEYDSLDIATVGMTQNESALPKLKILETFPSQAGAKPFALSTQKRVSITSVGGVIKLPLSGKSAQNKLNTFALGTKQTTGSPTSLYVVLDGLKITREGAQEGFVFDVLVSLTAKPGSKVASPVLIGGINIFNLDPLAPKTSFRFDVTKAVQTFGASKTFSTANLDVFLAPRPAVLPDGTPQVLTPSGVLFEFESVHVEALTDR